MTLPVRRPGRGGRHPRVRPRRGPRPDARCPAGGRCASSWRVPRRLRGPSSASSPSSAWEFIQIYGLTETAPLLTVNRAPADGTPSTSARAVAAALAGPACRPLGVRIAIDEEGEVLARSNHVFAGYWDQPEESAAALAGGWFHTGDGGYLDGAYLTISDRKKDVIITGGENVSSIEVEDCLYQHPAVAEVAVIGVPDEKWGETIKALVVVREGSTVDRGRAHRALPWAHGTLQGAHQRRIARRPWTARRRGSCRSTSSASPIGRARGARSISRGTPTPSGRGGRRAGPNAPRGPGARGGRRRPPPRLRSGGAGARPRCRAANRCRAGPAHC